MLSAMFETRSHHYLDWPWTCDPSATQGTGIVGCTTRTRYIPIVSITSLPSTKRCNERFSKENAPECGKLRMGKWFCFGHTHFTLYTIIWHCVAGQRQGQKQWQLKNVLSGTAHLLHSQSSALNQRKLWPLLDRQGELNNASRMKISNLKASPLKSDLLWSPTPSGLSKVQVTEQAF